jgi:hypothetical protein
MPRLTIFAKGNSDVADSLFACEDRNGRWGGINEALRTRGSDWRIVLRHETLTRSDALLQAEGEIPEALRRLPFAWPYDAANQFSATLFDGSADAYVLSIQPDVTMKLARHKVTGRVFYPGAPGETPPEVRAWLKAECEVAPLLTPEESRDNFKAVVARLRQRSDAPILVVNLSTVLPGDGAYVYRGIESALTTRIKRFNLGVVELSEETGVLVVDVDRLVARAGADRLKLDSVRLNVEGSRFVAEEVLRVLNSVGRLLPSRNMTSQKTGNNPPC